jgi:hypothetical protein
MSNEITSERALLMVFREIAVDICVIGHNENWEGECKMSRVCGCPNLYICLGKAKNKYDDTTSCWELFVFTCMEDIIANRNRLFRASAETKDCVRINFTPEETACSKETSEVIRKIKSRLDKLITVM